MSTSSEIAVVGAGPAGLAAAAAARACGADVLVLDENPAVGGQLWRASLARGARPEATRLVRLAAGARFEAGVTVFDASASPLSLATWHPERGAARVDARAVVLATGSTELFLPFPGWTLPGVTGVGGLQALVKGGLEVRGKRVLVAGTGPLLLAVAASLVKAGAEVREVLEQAPRRAVVRFGLGLASRPKKLGAAAALAGALARVRVTYGAYVARATGTRRVAQADVQDGAGRRTLDVDLLAVGFGLVPETRLAEHLGAERRGGAVAVGDDGATRVRGVFAAGELTGIGGVDASLAEGEAAGLAAAAACGHRVDAARLARARRRVARERRFGAALARAYALRPELAALADAATIVCRCEDVPRAALDGYAEARDAKLGSRCGMGPCQARVCGPALELLFGWPRESPRPPLVPVPFAALAER